jgi:hypothetical protein
MTKYHVFIINEDGSKSLLAIMDTVNDACAYISYLDKALEYSIEEQNQFGSKIIK